MMLAQIVFIMLMAVSQIGARPGPAAPQNLEFEWSIFDRIAVKFEWNYTMTFAVFEVKYEEGGNPPVFSANETSLEITTTGLKAATYYTVSVRVWDSGVPSPFSEEIVVATEAAEPENVTATTIDEHSIELRWANNPANGDYRIEVYRAIPEAEDFTAIVNVSSDSSSLLQQGLESGAGYVFSIAQYFAGHLGQKAEFIVNITKPPAPTGLSFENLTATDVTLVWDHFTNLPSEFISYAIEYTDNNWQSIRNVRVFENQHSFSALDLQNGLYRFRVATVISLAPHLTQKGQFSTVSIGTDTTEPPTIDVTTMKAVQTTEKEQVTEVQTTTTSTTTSTTTKTVLPTKCKKRCGKRDGSFQSCGGCEMYVVCSNGIMYNMVCPGGLVWDHSLKRCEWTSTTCP